MTNIEFIEKASKIHDDFYDYSLVDYKNCDTKVKIICPKHGEFEQTPYNHLKGRNCQKCSRENNARKILKLNTEIFTKKAVKIHNNFYDYSSSDVNGWDTKIKIICPIHGGFKQTPTNHLAGHGCKLCDLAAKKLTTEQFIERAKKIHNENYDYSLVDYKNRNSEVEIICKKCGKTFHQKPSVHLSGSGCSWCNKKVKLTNEQFIERAKKIHFDKYDYTRFNYINSETKSCIICPIHGEFFQSPHSHLRGRGCSKCNSSKGEIKTRNILIENNIEFQEQKKFNDLKDKSFLSYDFYIPSKKLLIEFNGIQHYKNHYKQKNEKQLHLQRHHDWLKRNYARKNGYNLLVLNNSSEIKQEIFKYLKS